MKGQNTPAGVLVPPYPMAPTQMSMTTNVIRQKQKVKYGIKQRPALQLTQKAYGVVFLSSNGKYKIWAT